MHEIWCILSLPCYTRAQTDTRFSLLMNSKMRIFSFKLNVENKNVYERARAYFFLVFVRLFRIAVRESIIDHLLVSEYVWFVVVAEPRHSEDLLLLLLLLVEKVKKNRNLYRNPMWDMSEHWCNVTKKIVQKYRKFCSNTDQCVSD